MKETAYQPLSTISLTGSSYEGGIAKWWYTPIENLNGFPNIDPTNQQLESEPKLLGGASWYGPVNIPTYQLGYEEPDAITPAGIIYRQKLVGFIPGHNSNSHINIRNLSQKQLCIVAKLRAGGFYIVIGNDEFGAILSSQYSSTVGVAGTPGTKLTFSLDSISKALVIPSFFLDNNGIVNFKTDEMLAVKSKIIPLNNSGDTIINWDGEMLSKYGALPTIEVWIDDGNGNYYKGNIPIDSIGIPASQFNIHNDGANGMVVIS